MPLKRPKLPKPETEQEASSKYPHFATYMKEIAKEMKPPKYYAKLDRSMKSLERPNVVYPLGGPTFVHVFENKERQRMYHAIEPRLTDEDGKLYDRVMDKLVEVANQEEVPPNISEMAPILEKLYDRVVKIGEPKKGIMSNFETKINITKDQYEMIKYYLIRNRIGYAKLEPMLLDPHLEDIHCTGLGPVQTIHKIFDFVTSNLIFNTHLELNKYITETSERVERPASDAHPIVDAMMPDGSRANFIYGKEVSLQGSSFTLRKFSEVPISVTQLINWGTFTSELAAYMWICLEHGMNLFVCGETASGKTTTLNALCAFIKPDDKVFTVENTPEVTMPHQCWQHLLTREAGKTSDVTYLDLLIAALRSRPNYIIVGEIRGQEGSIAFQAMQTGHPVMSTFHAGSVTTMIQRVTGDPINVPITFVDNLNLCLIQQPVFRNGKSLRRVLSITELERYYEPAKQMVTRRVFDWDPVNDKHIFKGLFNSYLLEEKIGKLLGYTDTRIIYQELDKRRKIIDKMIENKIFDYFDVWKLISNFHRGGDETLPFKLD